MNIQKAAEILKDRGKKLINEPYNSVDFFKEKKNIKKIVSDEEISKANELLNDLKNHPHFFVLACVMDRQTKAEKAWLVPFLVSKQIKSTEFKDFFKITSVEFVNMFKEKRFTKTIMMMFQIFGKIFLLVQE